MIVYICNAFSLSMLNREDQRGTPHGYLPSGADAVGRMARVPLPIDDPRGFLDALNMDMVEIVSAVGHADTARVFGRLLGRQIDVNRISVTVGKNNLALVGQYIGPRLPEGATELPEGARIEWWVV